MALPSNPGGGGFVRSISVGWLQGRSERLRCDIRVGASPPCGVATGFLSGSGVDGVPPPFKLRAITDGLSPSPNGQTIVSPTTAGQAFVPPGACHCQTTLP